MKRAALSILALLFVSTSALALVQERGIQLHRGDRIGVLRMSDRYASGSHGTASSAVRKYLADELRVKGFDAFDAGRTYDALDRNGSDNADYYIEIVSADADAQEQGGIGIGVDHVYADMAVVVSRVAAGIRVYDGHTLELIRTIDLDKSNRAVMPTNIGIGGHHVYAFFAIPFVHYAQYRRAAHDVARDAVAMLTQPQPQASR